jgi:hypothetical protein
MFVQSRNFFWAYEIRQPNEAPIDPKQLVNQTALTLQ